MSIRSFKAPHTRAVDLITRPTGQTVTAHHVFTLVNAKPSRTQRDPHDVQLGRLLAKYWCPERFARVEVDNKKPVFYSISGCQMLFLCRWEMHFPTGGDLAFAYPASLRWY